MSKSAKPTIQFERDGKSDTSMEHPLVRQLREKILKIETQHLDDFNALQEDRSLLDRSRQLVFSLENSGVGHMQELIGGTWQVLLATNQMNREEIFGAINAYVKIAQLLSKDDQSADLRDFGVILGKKG